MSSADYVPRLTPSDPRDVPLGQIMAEPGLHGGALNPGERLAPPPMPPGFTGSFTCCPQCPYASCERCEPREAWEEFRRVQAARVEQDEQQRRAASWWRRLTAASWRPEDLLNEQ